tara:strand:+ start:87 stop:1883 length:1797 start_codon:yes stop_codon:yes gene_type:complete
MSSPQGTIAVQKNKENKKIERMSIPEKDKMDVVCRTLQNVSKDIPLYMIIREALQNEIDSAIMRADSKEVEITLNPFHDSNGSVMVCGEGIGFTEEVVLNNFNSMFNSFKSQQLELQKDFDQCKGIGIKSAAYGRVDLDYKTRNEDNSLAFKFTSDEVGYPGLEKRTMTDDDGDDIECSISYVADAEFSYLTSSQTGTELLMSSIDGNNLSENLAKSIHSLFGSLGKKLKDNYGWSYVRFFNMRYWSFPENIGVKVIEGPKGKGIKIQGAEHYLKTKSINSGVKKYSIENESGDINFNLRWFIMDETMNNHFAIYTPFFAIKHKQELYGNLAGKHSRTSLLRNCGTSRAAERLVFIVEFEDSNISVPNSRKSVTIDGHDIDLMRVCESISEDLPREVQDFKDELIRSIPPEDLIFKNLRNFLRENYFVKKSPNLRVLNGKAKDDNDSRNNNTSVSGNGSTNDPPLGSRNKKSKRKAKVMVQQHALPKIIEDDTLPEDIWAYMNVKQWELSYNPNFKEIDQMKNYSTMLDYSTCPNTRKHVILGALLGKSIEWIFNQTHRNIKEQDSIIQNLLSEENLTSQAWLSSGAIAKQKKSESSK